MWGYFEYKINSRLTQSVNHLIRTKLFERIKSLPMTMLDDQRIGDSVYRVMYDAPSINQIFYEVINRPTLSTAVFLAAMYNLASAYPHVPEVIWFTALLFPMYLFITIPFSGMVRRRHQARRAAGTIVTSTIEEGMDNVLAVQSHTLIITLVCFFIISNVIDGKLTPGDFGALFFYFGWMRGPIISLSTLWIHLQSFSAGMRRVFALMDLPQEVDIGGKELPPVEKGVEFRGAGLVSPDGRRALRDINLTANVGQIIAFAGPTGAGKTSLAYLLPRYHMATEGEVLVDGHNVNDLTMQSLRNQITYVFQENQLFSDSIIDNISFGKPDASQN